MSLSLSLEILCLGFHISVCYYFVESELNTVLYCGNLSEKVSKNGGAVADEEDREEEGQAFQEAPE